MSELATASERLALSRQRLRQVLREGAAMPDHGNNPLIVAGTFAKEAVETAVQPLAQRNPLGLVAGAALAGAVLAWSRPWRWMFTPAMLASVLPQLVSKAVNHAPALPWMKVLSSLTQPRRKSHASL